MQVFGGKMLGRKLPILIIIPHGGTQIPEELEDIAAVEDFELLISSDTSANEIFRFDKNVSAVLNSPISKLFIDLNRSIYDIPPKTINGIIKKETPYGKNVFQEEYFPDEIAIANLTRRYYQPFHEAIDKITKSGEIELIIECHTIPAVGPKYASDADKPRPVIRISNTIDHKGTFIKTCPDIYAKILLTKLSSQFENENYSVSKPFIINPNPIYGFCIQKHFDRIPYLRLDISRALFFNEKFFNSDFMKIDQIRLNDIRKKIWNSIEKTYKKINSI